MTDARVDIPVFAVLGHPNEGKSSVVSTLTEDDRIRVSPVPGETTVSQTYTVTIDGNAIIRFVDTPGFQVPRQTLAWFREQAGSTAGILDRFIQTHKDDPFFADECELLAPVAAGAGIVYVVNGSRPVRGDDLAEMEILRLTGQPRMAIINSKNPNKDHTDEWMHEFRKHFNAIRLFNAGTAGFQERLRMLDTLKSIDQVWEPALTRVIQAFQGEWDRRIRLAAAIITRAIENSLRVSVSGGLDQGADPAQVRESLTRTYQEKVAGVEQAMFNEIRSLFKHRVYRPVLPAYSVLHHELFSRQTWELLGLTGKQLAAAGALAGGSLGVMADAAAHGLTFGVFTAIGGVVGAGSAVMGGRRMARQGPVGIRLGGDRIQVGPCKHLQFLYILLDRALIHYAGVINRPHGRRDQPGEAVAVPGEKQGISSGLTAAQRQVCARYFNTITGGGKPFVIRRRDGEKKAAVAFAALIEQRLIALSEPHGDPGAV